MSAPSIFTNKLTTKQRRTEPTGKSITRIQEYRTILARLLRDDSCTEFPWTMLRDWCKCASRRSWITSIRQSTVLPAIPPYSLLSVQHNVWILAIVPLSAAGYAGSGTFVTDSRHCVEHCRVNRPTRAAIVQLCQRSCRRPPRVSPYYIITGRICRRQLCRYCFYSRADFGFFRPTGATCCTDQSGIWLGGAN